MKMIKTIVEKVSVPSETKTKQKEYLNMGAIPIIDQGQSLIGGFTNDIKKIISCDLPVIVFGDHTCCIKYVDFPFGAGADGIKVLRPKDGVNPKYLYYGLQYLVLNLQNRGYGRHYQHIEKLGIPVPILHEQKIIVSQIEESLSQLDSAVETLKKTKQQLEIYRQAVLKEAFGTFGQMATIKDVADTRLGKMLDKEKNIGRKRKYLRNINVRWFDFDLSDLIEMRIKDNEIEKYSITKGDLVMCEGGEPGRCAVWNKEQTIFYQKALHRIRFSEKSNPYFYMYYFWLINQSGFLSKYFTGTGIKHLTGQSLAKVPIPICNREQQNKIVSYIENKIKLTANIQTTIDQSLQQAEALRQSILKQAFEGK
jgi:type I restriction enzyme S subunit